MPSAISVITVNPADWETTLNSADTLPCTLTYDPSDTRTPAYANQGINATNSVFYYESDSGSPADGPAELIMFIDTFDGGVEHRTTWLWVGTMYNGEAFFYDGSTYPVITNVY